MLQRSDDVLSQIRSFEELLLPHYLLQGLNSLGFVRPSPVQQAATPLARLGADLVVQAKAGTGKTVVFAVVCVEKADTNASIPQVKLLYLESMRFALLTCRELALVDS